MTTLTLFTKIYNSHQLKQISEILSEMLGELSVETTVSGTLVGKWVQLEISGEDETVAIKLLEREIGFCPADLKNLKKFSVLKGYIVNIDKSTTELSLDVGVFRPEETPAVISLKRLQAYFFNGKDVPLKKISDVWGLCQNLPLEIKVLKVIEEKNRIEAELQTDQIRKFLRWRDSLLDRLLIIGASLSEVNTAVEQEGLSRDVVDIDVLGIFEHAIVCKLGTDAAGLIGKVGRRLRKAKFTVFNSKRALAILDSPEVKSEKT